jgi:hypothetical protein
LLLRHLCVSGHHVNTEGIDREALAANHPIYYDDAEPL